MARDYDTQLLESVAVRRARMREALLWGRTRRRLSTVDNAKRFLISGIVAAVVCAGCVGWSFLQHALASQSSSSPVPTQPSGVAAPPSSPVPTQPSGIVAPPPSPPAPPSSVDPATTVRAFFDAINARDYHRAWDLGGRNLEASFDTFAKGYTNTARVDLTVTGGTGTTLNAQLHVTNTDSSTQNFNSSYTVLNGLITAGSQVPVR